MKLLAAIAAFVTTLHAFTAAGDVPQLGRGINLGNFLEAPQEGAWSGGRVLQDSDFVAIKQAGFAFARVPRFGAYDPKAQQWRAPLLKALVP